MPTGDIVELMVVFSLIVVPALGLTARFALKPIVDAVVRLKEGGVLGGSLGGASDAEVLRLRAEVRELREEMAQVSSIMGSLVETADFHRALREPGSGQLPEPGA